MSIMIVCCHCINGNASGIKHQKSGKYGDGLTLLHLNFDSMSFRIYQYDVLFDVPINFKSKPDRLLCHGNLRHVKDSFYSFRTYNPIEICLSDIIIEIDSSCNKSNNSKIFVDLKNTNKEYKIVYDIKMPNDNNIRLSVHNTDTIYINNEWTAINMAVVPNYFVKGFSLWNTYLFKYIKLPVLLNNGHTKYHRVIIKLPHFNDKVFEQIYLDGQMFEMENNVVKWNDDEYKGIENSYE